MPSNFLRCILSAAVLSISSVNAQQAPVPPPSGAPIPGPAVASQTSAPEATLIYRDASTPLTIGEMSRLQGKKLEDDFLKKLGLTSTPAVVAKPTEAAFDIDQRARVKPRGKVVPVGIYGPMKAPLADLMVNGVLITVRGGERLAGGLEIVSVGKTVQIILPNKKKKNSPLHYSIGVGDAIEFPL